MHDIYYSFQTTFFITAKANMTETHSFTSQMTSRLTWNKFSKCQ